MFLQKRCLSLMTFLMMLISITVFAQNADKGGAKIRFSLDTGSDDKPVTVTISGKVLDKATKQPIASAKVRSHLIILSHTTEPDRFEKCPKQETTTNAAGEYRFKYVTSLTMSGTFKGQDSACVDAGAEGYESRPQYLEASITPSQADFVNFDILLDKGKLIQGMLIDESGKAVADAEISIHSGLNGDWSYFHSLGETTSDANGKFRIWCSTDSGNVGKDPWLQVNKAGYGQGFYFGGLQKGDLGNLTLPKGSEIRGKVLASNGKAIANAQVLLSMWFNRIQKTHTDTEGNYVFGGVPREATIKEFHQSKNGRFAPRDAMMDVYARIDPNLPLGEAATCQISAPVDAVAIAPDLVIGANATVAGKLLPAKSTPALKGLMVRLDYDWGKMVAADADGRFKFTSVPAGKHKLTAYLPTNLRGDQGIGRTEIEAKPQEKISGIEIKLDELTEVRVQILDEAGNPLEGMTSGATWNPSGEGFWTEGTVTGPDGWSVLYLNGGGKQYIRGFDMQSHKLVASGYVEADPKPGEVIDNVRVTMVKPATITGRVIGPDNASLAGKDLRCTVNYADGTQSQNGLKLDAARKFEIKDLKPGAVKLVIRSLPVELTGSMDTVTEIKPGETKNFGDIALKAIQFHQVKGKLATSPTFPNLEGFKIRLDLEEWQPMVATDAQGNFVLDKVSTGKHQIIAYLPYNLRTDRESAAWRSK